MHVAVSRDGTPIAYDREGSGPALILVHGAMGHRASDPPQGRLASHLADAFTVHTYDRRGRGDSGDAGSGTDAGAVQREVEDLAALIGAAGGRAYLFGLSSGAVLALEAAARGLAVPALALYEPPFVVGFDRPPLPAGYREHVSALVAAGRRAEAVDYWLTASVGLPHGDLEPIRRGPAYARMQATAHTLAYDAAVVGDTMSGAPLPSHRWASVTAPVLVASGALTAPFFTSGADALAAVLTDVRRVTIADQDHGIAPGAIAPALRGFFGEMEARA